jgi:hypothetical protein
MANKSEIIWISSGGGPLLLLDETLLAYWGGTETPVGRPSFPSDYDRACSVNGYLGTVAVGPGSGVVLWDSPLQTAWYFLPQIREGVLIRSEWDSGDDAIIDSLERTEEIEWSDTEHRILVTSGRLVLFNAADSNNSLRQEHIISNGPYIGMKVGQYLDTIVSLGAQLDNEASRVVYAEWISADVLEGPSRDTVIIPFDNGVYSIETANYRPVEDIWLVLHRLEARHSNGRH